MPYGYNPSYTPSVNYFGNPYTLMVNQGSPMQQPIQSMQIGQQPATQQPGTLYARYVTGREEAIAATVLPDGTLNLFVDEQHGMIYGKAVAPNGAAMFREFVYRQPVQQPAEPQQNHWVTILQVLTMFFLQVVLQDFSHHCQLTVLLKNQVLFTIQKMHFVSAKIRLFLLQKQRA